MTATEPAERTTCEQCRSSMVSDQQWCLECGAARAVIHRPPDWRIGAGIVGVVVLLVAATSAVVLSNLSSNADRTASQAASARTPTQIAPTPSSTTSRTTHSTTSKSTTTTTSTSTSKTSTTTSSSAAASAGAGTGGFSGWAVGLSGYTAVLATAHSQAQAVASAQRLKASGLSVGVINSSQHPALPAGEWLVFSGRYTTLLDAQAAATAFDARGFSAHALLVGH